VVLLVVGGVALLSRSVETDDPSDRSTTTTVIPTVAVGSWYRVPISQLGVANSAVFWDVASTPFGIIASDGHGPLISEDGTSWQPLTPDPDILQGEIVAFASSDLGTLAVGTATAWFTRDGKTWTEINFPPDGPEWGYRPFVAASSDEFVIAIASQLWVSADGHDWVEITEDGDRPTKFSEIESTPFGFVAVGQAEFREMLWTSSDGIQWTRWDQVIDLSRVRTSGRSPSDFRITDVAGSRLGIAAVSTSGETWYSKDGIEWHQSTLPDIEPFNYNYVAGASESGFLIATASNNRELINPAAVTDRGAAPVYKDIPSAWFSTDGLTWTSVPYETTYESGHPPHFLQEVIPRGSGFLIVGEPAQSDSLNLGDASPVWIYEP
jgi:hypothetical protein